MRADTHYAGPRKEGRAELQLVVTRSRREYGHRRTYQAWPGGDAKLLFLELIIELDFLKLS